MPFRMKSLASPKPASGPVMGAVKPILSVPSPPPPPNLAALPLPVLARRSAAAGRAGLEFYVGIPGSVGGAVRMNAGGHGRETVEVLVEARAADNWDEAH